MSQCTIPYSMFFEGENFHELSSIREKLSLVILSTCQITSNCLCVCYMYRLL